MKGRQFGGLSNVNKDSVMKRFVHISDFFLNHCVILTGILNFYESQIYHIHVEGEVLVISKIPIE